MSRRRVLLVAVFLGSCSGVDFRLDPTPSCSYREERAEIPDGGAPVEDDPLSELAPGLRHGCVMVGEYDARCWGGNDLSQLSRRLAPEPGVAREYDEWNGPARLATGAAHTCAFTDEEVACFGNNAAGQLGDGMAEPVSGVTEVEGTGLEELDEPMRGAAGTGRVVCWGDDRAGQLGRDAEGGSARPPGPVDGLGSREVLDLAAGALHTCALVGSSEDASDREVRCWGDDSHGQLGDGEAGESRHRPQRVDLTGELTAIAAGPYHTCALLGGGRVFCWGRGADGELGDGAGMDSPTPVRAELSDEAQTVRAGGGGDLRVGPDGAVELEGGAGHTCAVDADGRGWCWGNNTAGQLGNGTSEDALVPRGVAGDHRWVDIAPGGGFTCGITTDDEMLCWGDNALGQLARTGDGSAFPMPTTVRQEHGF